MTGMAEMEVSPHKEMANRKIRKCSPLRDMYFLKISCLFVLCEECNRSYSDLRQIGRLSGVRYYSGRQR